MDLIDREALKKTIPATRADIFENCRNCKLLDDFTVIELIDKALPIDAKPVVHGEWTGISHTAFHGFDEWGEPIYRPCVTYVHRKCGFGSVIKHNYCPRCGADMRGEDKCD